MNPQSILNRGSYNANFLSGGVGGTLAYYLRDLFTGANGTLLTAHTMDVGPGWTVAEGSGGSIQGNKLSSANDTPYTCVANAGVVDATVQATVQITVASGTKAVGVVARWSDANNHWLATLNRDGTFTLFEKNAGSFTQRAQTTLTVNAGQDYVVALAVSGTSIAATVDGANTLNYTSSFNQSATRFGVRMVASDANPNLADNFQVA